MSEAGRDIWFVRSNGGAGSYPITAEGWKVVWRFVAGVAASAIIGGLLAMVGPAWLWIVVVVLGFGGSAWWFIQTARAHTDYTITYNEFVKDKKNA